MNAYAGRPLERTIPGYLTAVAAVAAALALRVLLEPLTGAGVPFLFFFAAVLLTSFFIGTGPGALALAISLPVATYASVTGSGTPASQAYFQALWYAVDGLIILYAASRVTKRRESLHTANDELRGLSDEAARSEARARQIIELSPDAFFLADLEARLTDVNQAACDLLGYEREELLGKTVFDMILPEDTERLNDVRDQLLVPGAIHQAEWTLKRKDGTTVPVDASANILADGRWQAFVRDITDRRRIEDQRQIFVSLLDNSVDFIGIADPNGKPIYLNAAGRRMIGLAPDFPVETLQILDCYPPELRSFVSDVLLKTMVEKGVWSGETFFQNLRTHERIPVSDTHFMIRDASGERILGMGTVTRDVTRERRIADEREHLLASELLARLEAESANAHLRESEERFRLAIDEAPIGMALISLDGHFVRVNRVLCEITGYGADELTTRRLQDITHPDDLGIEVALSQQLARAEIPRFQFEKRYLRKDGGIVDVTVSRSMMRDAEGAPLYYIAQVEDITARKRAEHALQRAMAARDDVLRVVAHDLRNPLSVITMEAQLMEHPSLITVRRDPPPWQIILRSARRMNQLIQDLLDVALVEAGQLKVEKTRLSPVQVAREAVESQITIAAASRIELRLETAPAVGEVRGDRQRLMQVFENLIGNAVKFSEPGDRIVVKVVPDDGVVLFSIADTGSGIEAESLEHVFDPFWQAASRADRLGAGLGLPLTKGIIEAHGGRIWVESEPGRGSTFYFTVPTSERS